MVNKCCIVGCKSLYIKDMVKVHRFPLENKRTLAYWIDFTGKGLGWTPTESSRLCCNHFIKSDYMPGHKKGVLKPTSVPSIKYTRIGFPNNSTSINNSMEILESRIIISPTENHNGSFVNTMEQIKNSTFNKIMTLKSKKPRCTQTIYTLYFKSPKIRKILSQGESINSLNYTEDIDTDNSGTIFCNSS